MTDKRQLLTTIALTYANGPLHLGHLVEAIQADIWVRFQRLQGHECYFVAGSDAHGTPIMLNAEKAGVTPEALIEKTHAEHKQAYADFKISFDNFYTTHSDENKQLSEQVYNRLFERGDITTNTIEQAFDETKQMFLPDRFVKGECPKCGAADQYGDSCEVCGATYDPTELKNPISAVSGTTPIQKESEHYFFALEKYEDTLKTWIHSGRLQPQIANKLNEWFEAGLRSWDISRDAPYFGFEIPNAPGKYFYVWLDAPIGYMASFKNYCDKQTDISFDTFWKADSQTELYHFIGKDIVYFHALFWPAILKGAGFRLPTAIYTHGFLTINGEKMSKSRGTFITAEQYLAQLDPAHIRYYFAAKLSSQVEDIDLSLEDFKLRVNSDLVGKVVNIASRCAGFITKKFDGQLASHLHDTDLFKAGTDLSNDIAQHYNNRDTGKAVRTIMGLADRINQYIDHHKPWTLAKEAGKENDVQAICTQGLNGFRQLMVYLKPILPDMAAATESFLQIDPLTWQDAQTPLLNHTITKFKPLTQRITDEALEAL